MLGSGREGGPAKSTSATINSGKRRSGSRIPAGPQWLAQSLYMPPRRCLYGGHRARARAHALSDRRGYLFNHHAGGAQGPLRRRSESRCSDCWRRRCIPGRLQMARPRPFFHQPVGRACVRTAIKRPPTHVTGRWFAARDGPALLCTLPPLLACTDISKTIRIRRPLWLMRALTAVSLFRSTQPRSRSYVAVV